MINVPEFGGSFTHQRYSQVESRIRNFEDWEIIGQDQSGQYNIYKIELGDKSKPAILLNAGMHGSEWQGPQYSMTFFESLRDDTFPDRTFRERLLNDFRIVYIPAINPWGYDQRPPVYENASGVSLNSDSYRQTQSETRAITELGRKVKPFAYLDIHLFQHFWSSASGNGSIVGNSQPGEIESRMITWQQSQENYMKEPVTRWNNTLSSTSGLIRAFFMRLGNEYTPETFSAITEFSRPTVRDGVTHERYTPEELSKYGQGSLYMFFKTVVKYFDDLGTLHDPMDSVDRIVTPHGEVFIYRDENGNAITIEEYKNDYILETIISRDGNGVAYEIETVRK